MADVAARAGVSRALVSIVFRGLPGASTENRERVLRAAAELDYRPDSRARLLGSSRSRTVGVVYGLHRPFHAEVVEALYAAAATRGWDLALEPAAPTRSEATAVQSLLDYRCEAVVLLGPALSRGALRELSERLPVVVVARRLRGVGIDSVRTDDEAAARLAVAHLVGLNHRRIAHVHGGRAAGAAERRTGYLAAMRDAELEPHLVEGGLDDAAGERAAQQLLAPGGPTAVIAFNDSCAAGVLAAARAAGAEVPARLSIVGFDNTAVAALSTVALTTVGQDARALADLALERAIARIEDEDQRVEDRVIPARLVVRRTTSPPGEIA